VDLHEVAGRAVVLDNRLGLLVVVGEPPVDRLGRVVGAALQVSALLQTLTRDRIVVLQEENERQRAVDLLEHFVERCRLDVVARVAVEHEAVATPFLDHAPDEGDRDLVGDELTRCEERRNLTAELRVGFDLGAVQVAGRDVRDLIFLRDPLRLRPLARPLRSEDQDVYLRNPS